MKRTLFIWGIYFLSLASTTFAAGVAIQTVFPNTSNDAALEYIEIINSSCESVQLGGFTLKDASGKVFIFPQENLDAKEQRRFLRSETGISLNNVDEVLELFDGSGTLVDTVKYTTSSKDIAILFDVALADCPGDTIPYPESISSQTGEMVYIDAISNELQNTADFFDLVFTGSLYSGALVGDFILEGVAISPDTTLNSLPLVAQCKILSTENISPVVSGSAQVIGTETDGLSLTSTGGIHESLDSQIPQTTTEEIPSSGSGSQVFIVPQKLYLWDLDSNKKLDTIEVVYSGILTGSLDASKLILYSAAGGLSQQKMEGSDRIQKVSIEENRLILTLREGESLTPHLSISPHTSSHLRLKTYAGFGLRGKNGESVTSLTYTQSFEGYNSALIWNYVEFPDTGKPPPPPPLLQSYSDTPAISGNKTPAFSEVSPTTGSVHSGSLFSLSPEIHLKDIMQSGFTPDGKCIQVHCKVNTAYIVPHKNITCAWDFVTSEGEIRSFSSCNPPVVVLGKNGGKIRLTLFNAETFTMTHHQFEILAFAEASSKSHSTQEDIQEKKIIKSGTEKSQKGMAQASLIKASKSPVSQKTGVQAMKKITVKSSPKKSTQKKVTTKTPKKEKIVASSHVKSESPKTTSGSAKDVSKKGSTTLTQENTSVITGVLGVACTILGFVFAAYKRKMTSDSVL